jgi:hypothetical protein
MRQHGTRYLSKRLAFLLAERLYVFRLSHRPVRFAGTRDFRHLSRRASSGEKAGGVGRTERGSREAPATEDIARGERTGHHDRTGKEFAITLGQMGLLVQALGWATRLVDKTSDIKRCKLTQARTPITSRYSAKTVVQPTPARL